MKRIRWFVLGAATGVWVTWKARAAVVRHTPAGMRDRVRAAVDEGRVAMREREAELRAELGRKGRQ